MGFLQIFWSETFVYLPFKVRSENSHIPPSTWLPHQLWYAHNTRLVLPTPTRFASCGCGSMLLTYNQRFWLVKLAVSQLWTCCDSQQVIITFLGWQIEPLAKRRVKNIEVQTSFSKHADVWINKKASNIDCSQKPLIFLSLMAETLISLNQILVSCPPTSPSYHCSSPSEQSKGSHPRPMAPQQKCFFSSVLRKSSPCDLRKEIMIEMIEMMTQNL